MANSNHFVFDRGGKVFKHSAPVIKLREGASESEYLTLLAVLNSSTACFWLKQQSQPKGGSAAYLWSRTYEFTSTTLVDYPLPPGLRADRGRELDRLAQEWASNEPSSMLGAISPLLISFDNSRTASEETRARMISEQEELDWEIYRLYGLIDEDLTYQRNDLPTLTLGQRAFEIALVRAAENGEEETGWFTKNESVPTAEIPSHWPIGYRRLIAAAAGIDRK